MTEYRLTVDIKPLFGTPGRLGEFGEYLTWTVEGEKDAQIIGKVVKRKGPKVVKVSMTEGK